MYYELIWGSEADEEAEQSTIKIFNFGLFSDDRFADESDPLRSNEMIYMAQEDKVTKKRSIVEQTIEMA
eukprot:CAMPEP_0116878966 /NCGR_PEP_ID=MMETSP0463-20121206/10719_1 /TAXON_ID=181622 /ORGANISM="Strombidinopsis sp, Strain SopsisLIS2011" /LENGTH=68 /DNA_ID=CAMNT_0004527721 /DNA_START=525 /DNA_END=731 /DNA_ORIENTATION=-